MKKFLILCLLPLNIFASDFNEKTLLTDQEVWRTEYVDKKDGFKTNVTLSFFGTKPYDVDVKRNRVKNAPEDVLQILRGFIIINNANNPKIIPKDCPHPLVITLPVKGLKDSKGNIVLYTVKENPLFNGSGVILEQISTFEIHDIKDKEGIISSSGYNFVPYDVNFVPNKRIETKIFRIK